MKELEMFLYEIIREKHREQFPLLSTWLVTALFPKPVSGDPKVLPVFCRSHPEGALIFPASRMSPAIFSAILDAMLATTWPLAR